MENLLLISEAAQELEQHGNSARIKKLIFATWKNCWENDLSLINRFPLTNILQELVNNAPTAERLRAALFNIVNTLNKKDEYAVIAEIILTKLASLYPAEEPKTEMVVNRATSTPSPAPAIYPQPAPPKVAPKESGMDTITNIKVSANKVQAVEDVSPQDRVIVDSPNNQFIDNQFIGNHTIAAPQNSQYLPVTSVHSNLQTNIDYNPFVIRLAIMKYSNPLRAKMLLLCIVEEQVIFNQGSWLKLRSRNLDELLTEVFQKFSSLEQLESQLQVIANNLQEPDENMQAAEAIIKAIKPFYPV